MKRLVLFILVPLFCIAVFVIYIYVSALLEKDKTYYFPQIEMYLKIHKPPFSKYGYVVLGKDSVFSFSENIDFVKIYKSEISSINFIFNPKEHNKLYIVDNWNNAQINQVNFSIEKINRDDSVFFTKETIANMYDIPVLKSIYFEITVDGFLQSLSYIDSQKLEEYPIKAEPIK